MTARLLVVAAVLLTSAGAMRAVGRSEYVPPDTRLNTFPSRLGTWIGRELPPFDERIMKTLGADDYVSRLYTGPEASVAGLYIGYYKTQRQGDTIHSPLNCLPGAGWQPVSAGRVVIPIDGRAPIEVNRYIVQKGEERQLVLYWYQSQGRVVASEYWGKVYLVLDAIRTRRSDAALIRVMSPIEAHRDSEDEAARNAIDFVRTIFPRLVEHLPS